MDGDDDETLDRVEHGEEDLGDEERWELISDTGFDFLAFSGYERQTHWNI